MRYPVVIHQEKDSAYGVTVPDIPGCFSAGDTIDEAMENAREAIFAHLELLTEGGGDIANARAIEEHKGNKDYAGGIWAFVDANVEDLLGPAERVNVTIPKRALQKIDSAAKLRGDTRSGLLTQAALSFISHSGAGNAPTRKAGRSGAFAAGKIVESTRVPAKVAAAPRGRRTTAKQRNPRS
jgi:predicted RNase H-like HicB family nuclease